MSTTYTFYSTIFTTKNNELVIFGQTLSETKEKIIELFKAFERGGIKGQDGVIETFFSKNKKSILTPELLRDFENFKNEFNNTSLSAEALKEKFIEIDQRIIDYAKTCKNGEMTTKGFKKSIDTMSFSAKASKVALHSLATIGNIFAGMAIAWAGSKLFEGLDYLINYEEKQKEVFEKAKSATEEAAKSILDLKSKMSDTSTKTSELSAKFANLVQGVNPLTNENKSLSTEQYEEFLDVNNQLAELFPSLTHNYDENGNAILGLSGDVDTVTASIKRLVEQQNNLAKADMRKHLDEYVNGSDDVDGIFKVLEGQNKEVKDAENDLQSLKDTYNGIIEKKGGKYFDMDGHAYQKYLTDIKNKLGQEAYDALYNATVTGEGFGGSKTYAIDFSKIELDETSKGKITESYNTFYGDLESTLDTKKSELRAKNQEMSNMMMIWVEDIGLYKDSDNEYFQKAIESMVKSIQWSDVDVEKGNLDGAKQFIQKNVLNYFQKAANDPEAKLRLTDALRNLFTLNIKGLNVDDARTKIQKFCKTIAEILGISFEDVQKNLGLGDFFETASNYDRVVAYASGGNYKSAKNLKESKGFNQDDVLKAMDDNSINSNEEINKFHNILTTAKSLNEAIRTYTNSSPVAENTPIPFSKAWNALGTESDADTAKTSAETKEKLLELAEAGKLTVDAFENSSIAENFMKETGLSAEKVTEKINGLVENVKQLDSMRTGITAITSAYDEKKNSKNHAVSPTTLNSMYNTLGIEKWDDANKKVWKNYKKCATDGKKSMADIKDAQDELATSYVNSNNFLADLDLENEDYYKTLLTQMGVTNADAIVTNKLAKKKGLAAIKTADLANMTSDEITALILEKGKTDDARNAMKLFALQKYYANGNALNTTQDMNQLILLMESLGLATDAIRKYRDYKEGKLGDKAGDGMVYEFNARNEIEKITKKLGKKTKVKPAIDVELTNGGKSNGKNKDKDKDDKPKETKTEIDWLSRRLTRMQSIIDLTASKLQNLFSIKAKNKNLNDQIKETTALMKQYGIAAKRYQSKADSIADGKKKGKKKTDPLPKSILNQVESGKITKKSYPKLIKKYGQNYADRINQYIDYYDKAKDAKKNKQDAKAKVRDLKQQRHQTYIDLYDSRIARAEAKESIQTNAEGKNKTIKTQIENTKESYAHQIKIANLTKNKAEADRLKYEKQQKIKELKEKGLQYYADEYNAKADLAETRSGNAVGYQKQNSYVDTQLSYLQKSYEKQIAIAKLSKDKTEQDRLQAEYEAKKTELKQKQIENLKTDFENKIGFIRNDGQDVSNKISEAEARGDIVQSSYYSALNRYEQSALNSMETELQELKKEQGSFAMYSPEWYSLQSDIQSVENSISETNISIIENNKKIGELRQAMYDDIASRNSNVGSESQFIAELLGDNLTNDKTGTLTREGLGVLGTYGIELEANTSTALSYKKQREEIEQAIASYKGGNIHALDSYGSLKKAEEKLNEAIKNQQGAITAEYSSMKKIYDMMVKRYETQLAYMKTIIDAKKQVLSMEKDLYDYQKNISNQTKNIAALEKQLAALKGDDSEEGRAKRSRLMVSLDEANQNLQDTEYDRYISDQQNMLDNMYTQYEDLLSELEKDFEAVVKDGMNIINETASGISTTLNDIAGKYGYNPSSDMSDILGVMKSSNGTIVKTLPETITNGLSGLGKILQDNVNAIVATYSGKPPVSGNNSDATNGGGSGSGSSNPGGTSDPYATTRYTKEHAEAIALENFLKSHSGSSSDITKPLKKADPGKTYKSKLNQILSQYGYVVKSGTGTHGLKYINMFAQILGLQFGDGSFDTNGVVYKKLKKKYPSIGFRTGGIVRADGVSKDGDYVPVRVNPDETILTQKFTKMLPETVDIMKDFINVTGYARLVEPRKAGNTFGDIVINAELPNVTDTYDFANDLQNNKRTQKSIEVSVHDLMTKGIITSNIQRI